MKKEQAWYCVIRTFAAIAVALILVSGAWAANQEKVIYNFSGGGDGGDPTSTLVFDSAGNAYGTTAQGGAFGFGTVFKLTPKSGKWVETVLYSFLGGSDGKNPYGGVAFDSDGTLYGTTAAGGIGGVCGGDGCGVIYKMTNLGKSWTQSVIYNFTGGKDGFDPGGTLIVDSQFNLYGTTADGGKKGGCSGQGCGVVFKLSRPHQTVWIETVLHTFTGGADGAVGSLGPLVLDKAGNLYGVAELGGDTTCNPPTGCGTVYRLKAMTDGTWKFTSLYGFKGTPDASFVYGGVTPDAKGNLYGTSYFGGKNGMGSVYKLTKANGKYTEKVIYNFKGGRDASLPTSTLVFDATGNLYGSSSTGGRPSCDCGTIFKLTPSGSHWTESIVHRFGVFPDGSTPTYGLTMDSAGNFFGVTPVGGTHKQGTVFEFTP